MWANNSGSWAQNQWPMQQAMYQNIPHEQVDWAALAQQWIQMRETMSDIPNSGNGGPPMAPPPFGRGNGGPPPGPHLMGRGGGGGSGMHHHHHHPPPPYPNRPPPHLDAPSNTAENDRHFDWDNYDYGNSSEWNSMAPGSSSSGWTSFSMSDSKNEEFGGGGSGSGNEFGGPPHGNQGFADQAYDYNHSSDQFGLNQSGPDQAPVPYSGQYWTQGGRQAPPPFLRRESQGSKFDRKPSSPVSEEQEDPSAIDAAKRKHLPAWIREGLEKMEREKQKKMERERMLKEREEHLKREKEAEGAMNDIQEKANLGLQPKSKFESDSEDDDDDDASPLHDDRRTLHRRSPRRSLSPVQASPKTEQERMEELMLKVRRLLTEILLEVTNEEIAAVAKEVLSKVRSKAPALQLAKSSALASITGRLGLEAYGTDSDDASGPEDDDHGDPAYDSDEQLKENIRKRQIEFAERERKSSLNDSETIGFSGVVKTGGRREEQDERNVSEGSSKVFLGLNLDSGGSDRYHFEKKYSAIPGLGGDCDADQQQTQSDEGKRLDSFSEDVISSRSEKSKPNNSKKQKSSGSSDSDESSSSSYSSSDTATTSSNSNIDKKKRPDLSKRVRSRSRERKISSSSNRRSRERRDSDRKRSARRSSSSERDSHRRRNSRRRSRRSSSSVSSSSRSRSRERSSRHRRRSRSPPPPSDRRRERRNLKRSRSRSPRSRSDSNRKSRHSRSRSRESYDRRTGKKSTRKPRS